MLWGISATLRVAMGQHVETGCSGQGSAALGAIQTLTEFDCAITTFATYASPAGLVGIRRVHQQGWIGVGVTPPAGPQVGNIVLTDDRYVRLENDAHVYPPGTPILADTIYWDIQPGGVVTIEVDW